MTVAPRIFTVTIIKQSVPFAYIASVISRELGAFGYGVACEPFWEYSLGEFVVGVSVNDTVDLEVTLNEEALKLHGRHEIWRREETFNFSAKLRCFSNVVKMLVPVFRRICKQMMVLYFIFRCRDPVTGVACQKLRISVLRQVQETCLSNCEL